MKDRRQAAVLQASKGIIEYKSGNRLEYFLDSRPFSNIINYYHKGKRLNLNDLLPEGGRWIIEAIEPIRTKDIFEASVYGGINDSWSGRILLDIKSVRDETLVLRALHEIGHAHVVEMLIDYALGKKDYQHLKPLFRKKSLLAAINEKKDVNGRYHQRTHNKDYLKLFSERQAWAYALRTVRRYDLFSWLSRDELRKNYYECSLKTYEDHMAFAVTQKKRKTHLIQERYARRLSLSR